MILHISSPSQDTINSNYTMPSLMNTAIFITWYSVLAAFGGIFVTGVSWHTTNSIPSAAGLLDPTTHLSRCGQALCVSGTISITASTDSNLEFNYDMPETQSQLIQTFVSLWSAGSTFKDDIMVGNLDVGGTYNISTTICGPASGSFPNKVQVLTHGIGFDRFYWDFAPRYSYVDAAVSAGYTIAFYDRLGVGLSSKEDPHHTVQSPLELSILSSLFQKLRYGQITNTTFSTIIGVGHSFDSAITQGLCAVHPTALDAAVLTGFSTYHGGMPTFSLGQNIAIASLNQPYRFSRLSNGYTVVDTEISNQIAFFHAPKFDPAILSLAAATKGTTTLGEFFTTGNTVQSTDDFARPLVIVDAAEDLGFGFGNCSYPEDRLQQTLAELFPSLPKNRTRTYIVPNTGHRMNLHYSAGEAFAFIQQFLQEQGF